MRTFLWSWLWPEFSDTFVWYQKKIWIMDKYEGYSGHKIQSSSPEYQMNRLLQYSDPLLVTMNLPIISIEWGSLVKVVRQGAPERSSTMRRGKIWNVHASRYLHCAAYTYSSICKKRVKKCVIFDKFIAQKGSPQKQDIFNKR